MIMDTYLKFAAQWYPALRELGWVLLNTHFVAEHLAEPVKKWRLAPSIHHDDIFVAYKMPPEMRDEKLLGWDYKRGTPALGESSQVRGENEVSSSSCFLFAV